MIKLFCCILVAMTVVLITGCPSECIQPAYQFQATAHVNPERESLLVGDTIWIQSTVPSTLRDQRSNQDVNFSNAVNFGSTLRIAELRFESDTLIDAVNRFTPLATKGKVYTLPNFMPARALQYEYVQTGAQYQLRIGLICRQKGTFALFISPAANVHQRDKTVCQGASIQVNVDNADKHLNYLQDLYFKTYPVEESVKQTSYCFVVR